MKALEITTCTAEELAPIAAGILREAWKPPCLDYSSEYLEWQFSRPTSLPFIGVVALAEGKPIGCAPAVGHRMTIDGKEVETYLASHFAVLPGASPMAGGYLVRTETRAIAASCGSALTFAEPGSIGEAMLAGIDSVGMKRRLVGTITLHMAAPRGDSPCRTRTVGSTEWQQALASLPAPERSLEPWFGEEEIAHYRSHPWGRDFAICEQDGNVIGAAMIGETRSLGKSGPQRIGTIYWARVLSAEALKSLALLAVSTYQSAVVSLPNCVNIGTDLLRGAGFRQTPVKFNAYLNLSAPDREPFVRVESVGIETT